MAKVLQHRRGTTAEHANFTGAAGEVTVDTTEKRLVVHDGSTKGGVPAAKKSEIVDAKSELQQAINGLAEEVGTAQEGLQQAIEQEKIDIRALIADELKKHLPLIGGTMAGTLTVMQGDDSIVAPNDNSYIEIEGGTKYGNGAKLTLHGKDSPNKGQFSLSAKDGTNSSDLVGKADGALLWRGVKVLNVSEVIYVGGSTSITVPSGGTWAYFGFYWTKGYDFSAPFYGTVAGGTVVVAPDSATHTAVAICVRQS